MRNTCGSDQSSKPISKPAACGWKAVRRQEVANAGRRVDGIRIGPQRRGGDSDQDDERNVFHTS